ncbi:helix-turn-helix transcriptional regulator [Aerococcaceae bacterium zg-ZUI334]|uniref:helix-turn-helix transcriptional regulator n=1 Tax=Aerococcaceae bacterium zg-252 TaxID=2796928 RepID=UPI001B99148F|nr:helix-turn-helix transcriptional regulator [Aerococcaceae bacterium zg-ZUI334]
MNVRLKEIREEYNLSQKELADLLGIEKRTVSNIETGKASFSLDTAIKICDLFGITIDELVDRRVPEPSEELLQFVEGKENV